MLKNVEGAEIIFNCKEGTQSIAFLIHYDLIFNLELFEKTIFSIRVLSGKDASEARLNFANHRE